MTRGNCDGHHDGTLAPEGAASITYSKITIQVHHVPNGYVKNVSDLSNFCLFMNCPEVVEPIGSSAVTKTLPDGTTETVNVTTRKGKLESNGISAGFNIVHKLDDPGNYSVNAANLVHAYYDPGRWMRCAIGFDIDPMWVQITDTDGAEGSTEPGKNARLKLDMLSDYSIDLDNSQGLFSGPLHKDGVIEYDVNARYISNTFFNQVGSGLYGTFINWLFSINNKAGSEYTAILDDNTMTTEYEGDDKHIDAWGTMSGKATIQRCLNYTRGHSLGEIWYGAMCFQGTDEETSPGSAGGIGCYVLPAPDCFQYCTAKDTGDFKLLATEDYYKTTKPTIKETDNEIYKWFHSDPKVYKDLYVTTGGKDAYYILRDWYCEDLSVSTDKQVSARYDYYIKTINRFYKYMLRALENDYDKYVIGSSTFNEFANQTEHFDGYISASVLNAKYKLNNQDYYCTKQLGGERVWLDTPNGPDANPFKGLYTQIDVDEISNTKQTADKYNKLEEGEFPQSGKIYYAYNTSETQTFAAFVLMTDYGETAMTTEADAWLYTSALSQVYFPQDGNPLPRSLYIDSGCTIKPGNLGDEESPFKDIGEAYRGLVYNNKNVVTDIRDIALGNAGGDYYSSYGSGDDISERALYPSVIGYNGMPAINLDYEQLDTDENSNDGNLVKYLNPNPNKVINKVPNTGYYNFTVKNGYVEYEYNPSDKALLTRPKIYVERYYDSSKLEISKYNHSRYSLNPATSLGGASGYEPLVGERHIYRIILTKKKSEINSSYKDLKDTDANFENIELTHDLADGIYNTGKVTLSYRGLDDYIKHNYTGEGVRWDHGKRYKNTASITLKERDARPFNNYFNSSSLASSNARGVSKSWTYGFTFFIL